MTDDKLQMTNLRNRMRVTEGNSQSVICYLSFVIADEPKASPEVTP